MNNMWIYNDIYIYIYLHDMNIFVATCYCSNVDTSDPNLWLAAAFDSDEVRPKQGEVMLVAQKQLPGLEWLCWYYL